MAAWRSVTVAVALLFAALTAGCSIPPVEQPSSTPQFELIEPDSAGFAAIDDSQFRDWYDSCLTVSGLHSLSVDDERYLLIVAPEQPSASYRIEPELTGDSEQLHIHARLIREGPGPVTMPAVVVRIADDSRRLVYEGMTLPSEQLHEDSGRYVGRDGSRIDIRISGAPDSIPPREFILDDTILDQVDRLGLKSGDQIRFAYAVRDGQPVIVQLHRMN